MMHAPIPIKAFDCIVFIRIPSDRERLSIISNPTYHRESTKLD